MLQLNEIVMNEYNALKALLDALDEQFEYLTKREVFSLGKVVEKIEQCSREVARWEVERRKITGGEAMTSIVDKMKNENLENNYRSVKKLLEEIQLQKDTNEMIIKQGLGFSTQMLNFINPDRGPKTYNGYGKRR
ncbi:flagellar protein FlgN [Clostridium sp. DJ247]|uniref:flagellar protein FlgN n=1 Tax=Clostridium sp. DJ247 TaxID=2726188 RepID=UPI0028BF543A|nr:flagellar protein FlgN [Clostridium sp. DJ247]